MYERKSRLSERKRDRLMEHSVAGTTARAVAELAGVHRNTAASFYSRLCKVIAKEMETGSGRNLFGHDDTATAYAHRRRDECVWNFVCTVLSDAATENYRSIPSHRHNDGRRRMHGLSNRLR